MAEETFADRLKVLIGDQSANSFAREVDIGESSLRKYLAGATPGIDKVAQIARIKDVTLDWLINGKEPNKDDHQSTNQSDFTLVPRLDVQASAGNGALAQSEEPVDFLAFQESWLRERNIKPRFARVLTARGDSMEPTIRDGDVLLVDTSITSVYDNAIYIVVYNGHVLVKRVNLKRDGALTIISDNDRHPPEEVPLAEVPDLHIAGRVMWFGRSI